MVEIATLERSLIEPQALLISRWHDDLVRHTARSAALSPTIFADPDRLHRTAQCEPRSELTK
ncbi:hypothetical protein ABIB90_008390 [Bradyrhizobium sp. JR4.1]|uniref:hypothetical protein n=1 Tax=unclassified Bradyrhizobium TaxID=2631580 RepID=UPI0012EC67ED|nr:MULTISPECIES: hypothetical protein [unclassified Bradyrhizobium]MDH2357581.1 hypothetical protein [Bradyrhizobium sp. SSUT112]